MTKINFPSISRVKARAKVIKKDHQIPHMKALEVAAQEIGYPSFHALDTYLKRVKHKQTSLSFATYNPKYHSSLLVVFNDDLVFTRYDMADGEVVSTTYDFKKDFLDRGFAEKLGARLLSNDDVRERKLIAAGGSYGDYLADWGYVCLEFLRDKNTPWTLEDAEALVIDKVETIIGRNYREFFYLDNQIVDNHISRELQEAWDNYLDIDYHPAIDGY